MGVVKITIFDFDFDFLEDFVSLVMMRLNEAPRC